MKQKIGLLIPIFIAIVGLAACSGQPAQVNAANTPSSNSGGANNQPNNNTSNIDNNLAPGILMLEGSAQAVTSQQAAKLLPLWQQIQTLETSGTASNSDYQTVYQQIESNLTSGQIQAIQNMTFSQSTLQDLMTKLNIQVTPGSFNGSRPTLSPDELATLTAEGTQTPGNNRGRFFSGTGTPPAYTPDANGAGSGFLNGNGTPPAFTPGANGNGGGRSFNANGTPFAPGQFGNRGGNMAIFLNPLIQLLQQRAGS